MAQEIIMIIVVVVIIVALFLLAYFRGKKRNAEYNQLRANLKVGDKVMTDTGVVGIVVDQFTEDEYKYVVLESGHADKKGYLTVHANAIYFVFDDEKKAEKVTVKVKPKEEKEEKEEKRD